LGGMSLGQVGCQFFEIQPAAGGISKTVKIYLNNFLTILCYVGDASIRVTAPVDIVRASCHPS
jgi:hypothetical protein